MFAVPKFPRSDLRAIAWWELRRPAFNVWLAVTGAVSLGMYAIGVRLESGALPTSDDLYTMIIVVFGLANTLYTMGWIFEIDPRATTPRDERDPVAVSAFLEIGCWVVALGCFVPALLKLVMAIGVWARHR